jgi:hypothetical protein
MPENTRRPRNLNIVGTENKEYDLDIIESESRLNSDKPLVVQVHRYNPLSIYPEKRNPNPDNIKIGQIWLSKLDKTIE